MTNSFDKKAGNAITRRSFISRAGQGFLAANVAGALC